ncbi:MAG: antibiotic biosynthesis monooxygenase [Frankiaceae bacterium]|nr:antibiotic biosynthesis monooxygenase [Frankiaceae bacterium]
MWAQIIKTQLKAGHDGDFVDLMKHFQAAEKPGSGLVHSYAARDQKDPNTVYMIVVFESEEKARVREADAERQASLEPARQIMGEIFEGPVEFLDLDVVAEHAGTS